MNGFRIDDLQFAHPEWLRGLYGLPLIVLLYLLRRRASRLVVPHLVLWEDVLRARRRRAPWRRLLVSILLQMLIFAVAILAVADPCRDTVVPEPGHTVIVMDRSLGTAARGPDGESVASVVVREAERLAEQVAAEGTVSVGILADEVMPLDPGGPGRSLATLPLPEPAGARDIAALVRSTRSLVTPHSRVVYLAPFRPSDAELTELRRAGIAVLGAGAGTPNAGIVSVRRTEHGTLELRIVGEGGPRTVFARGAGDRVPLAEVVPTPAGTTATVTLPAGVGARPTLELDPRDGFPEDDLAPLVLPEREGLAVLVVADRPTPWLDAFLEGWQRSEGRLDVARSARVDSAAYRDLVPRYDVVVLVGLELGLPLPPGRFLLLGSLAPDLGVARTGAAGGAAEALKTRREDPLVRALDLSEWKIHRMLPLEARAGLDVVVDGSAGPLVARGVSGEARFVMVGVEPDPVASTLPLLPAWPLLVDAALTELGGVRDEARPVVLGIETAFRILPGESATLESERGEQVELVPLPDGTGHRLPSRPGRYRVVPGGAGPESARTIALAVLDHPGRPGAAMSTSDPLPRFPTRNERRSLRVPLLFALLSLLAAEFLLYTRLHSD